MDLVEPGLVAGAVGLALGVFKFAERGWDKRNGGNKIIEMSFNIEELRRETGEQTAVLREIRDSLK